ncbi:hypothetical protein ACRAQ6_13965 [Erythrobacter sp. HA6-11]
MADLSITPANVVPGSTARIARGTAGATLAAGKAVYLDPADNKYKLADCDDPSAAIRNASGIALNGASDGQPVAVLEKGPMAIGATVAPGVPYYLSPVAGGIAPYADLTSGDYPIYIGMGISTTEIDVRVHNPGAVLA